MTSMPAVHPKTISELAHLFSALVGAGIAALGAKNHGAIAPELRGLRRARFPD